MDLAERVGTGRRVDGEARVVRLGVAVPAAPPSLADVRVEVRAVGNTLLSVTSEALAGPRPPAFWRALSEEVHAFLGADPCASEVAVVAHVVRGLGDHAVAERIARLLTDILEGRVSLPPSAVGSPRPREGAVVATVRVDG